MKYTLCLLPYLEKYSTGWSISEEFETETNTSKRRGGKREIQRIAMKIPQNLMATYK